jgi:hypothetical protein
MAVTIAALIAYVAVAYGHGLRLAFLNDDYLFLDKIRGASFRRSTEVCRHVDHCRKALSRDRLAA